MKISNYQNFIILSLFLFTWISKGYAQAFDFQEDIESFVMEAITTEEVKPAADSDVTLISFAKQYIGAPYKYGGSTPSGFDCSGFVCYVYNEFGVSLPRSSRDMGRAGVKISNKKYQVGDLIFFEDRHKSGSVGHVGIICEINGDDVFFIHASTQSNVVISNLKEDYYTKRFLEVRRIYPHHNNKS